ncbi:MAG: hypothetical protein ACTTIA_02435 [Candidatus Cryptobacteroides sp.]
MTVKELKERLNDYPDDYEVGYIDGNDFYVEIGKIREGCLWNIILE